MKSASSRLLLPACALLIWALASSTASMQSAAQPAAAADEPGAALLVKMCNDCHDSERILTPRRTKDDWQSVINKMIEYGAMGDPKDFETLFAFLVRAHGQIHINDAPADEVSMALGLLKKDADAIVAYRTAHGAFADYDALKKVPDIDLKTLDAHKDALLF